MIEKFVKDTFDRHVKRFITAKDLHKIYLKYAKENGLEELTRKYRGYAESVIKRQGNIVYFGAEENWKEIK